MTLCLCLLCRLPEDYMFGQPIRYLAEYIGIDYEEKRYEMGPAPDFSMDDWMKEKYTLGLEFPNLPYMIDGDVKLTQSYAIMRYLARKENLLGTNDEEVIRVDLIAEQSQELRLFMVRHFYNPKWLEIKADFVKSAGKMLKEFSDFLGEYPWFAGQNISFADFAMYELIDQLLAVDAAILDNHKNLQALPAVDAYRKSDRFISRPIHGKLSKFGYE
ncbi:glutathione S-transferase Mu 1-like isoform X4 [Ptychodera flava]|uniref:glutathione S-transferase Mu 1-like isoform X4 n=1 Tax=Ptychodera flava TaxID=63121 RepID=UPI00396A99F6